MNIYNLDSLLNAIQQGQTVQYIFFWGHQAQTDGAISASCLSQWYEASFTVNQITYLTAEQYMMAEKARLFNDESTLEKILDATNPRDSKRLGREVENFDIQIWKQKAFQIVCEGNKEKFKQNEALMEYLIGTENCILVEASPVDSIWGIGLSADHPNSRKPDQWNGCNQLGFALMQVRKKLVT